MSNKTCIECGGWRGHHFTGCPETPEPPPSDTILSHYLICGTPKDTVRASRDGVNGWAVWQRHCDSLTQALAECRIDMAVNGLERATVDVHYSKFRETRNLRPSRLWKENTKKA